MILHIVGARPNFIKMAPLILECKRKRLRQFVVHTGQHYDRQMSDVFFRDLKLAHWDVNLRVRAASPMSQISEMMLSFEKVCLKVKPKLVVIPGDVNSSFACALTAAKLNIPIAHLESGLRSFDPKMQEEKNRIVIDHLSDLLFVTEKSGLKNLKSEGVQTRKIHFCGNTMIDSLKENYRVINTLRTYEDFDLRKKKYILMTMHRPENVDHDETFKNIVEIIQNASSKLPIILPVHPRVSKNKIQILKTIKNFRLAQPLGYLDFMCLMQNAKIVMTDSGGVQEETTYLGVPCLTLRENTERPVTVQRGTNQIVGLNPATVFKHVEKCIKQKRIKKTRKRPELWDGKAAVRVVSVIEKWMKNEVTRDNTSLKKTII